MSCSTLDFPQVSSSNLNQVLKEATNLISSSLLFSFSSLTCVQPDRHRVKWQRRLSIHTVQRIGLMDHA